MKTFDEFVSEERPPINEAETPDPGHHMHFQGGHHEHSFHGYGAAKQQRDAYAKYLQRKGHKVKKTSLQNQLLHGSYGNVYVAHYNESIEGNPGMKKFNEFISEDKKPSPDEEVLNELSPTTLKSYIRKSYGDIGHQSGMVAHLKVKKYKHPWLKKSSADQLAVHTRKEKNRGAGLDRALTQLEKKNVKEEIVIESALKSSHGTADGHSHKVKSSYANGKFSGTIHTSHRDNRYSYTGPEPTSPVEHEKPKSWSHTLKHGTTTSAIRKKNPHLDATQAQAVSRHFEEHKNKVRQLSEGTQVTEEVQLDEMMTRKHFQQVADVIKAHPDAAKRAELAKHHAGIFKASNPRFDHKRFYAAANASVNEEQLNELSPATLKSYTKKAVADMRFHSGMIGHIGAKKYKHHLLQKSSREQMMRHVRKEKNRSVGVDRALDKRNTVKEEAENPSLPKTNAHKVGDKVTPKMGVHQGQVHTVIHVHADGSYNIKPDVKHSSLNKYRQGAVRAQHKDLE